MAGFANDASERSDVLAGDQSVPNVPRRYIFAPHAGSNKNISGKDVPVPHAHFQGYLVLSCCHYP